MTSNDKQIDLLMRRYAKAAPVSVTGHLDADELSAFAEGALPAASRASYVSHLADCDQCRKQASDLTISSGAIVRAEQTHAEISEGRTFWTALAGLFALPVLRYAAFAAVLLIVAGVAFVALRRPTNSSLIALNEPGNQQPVSAVKPSASPQEGLFYDKQANAAPATSSPSQLRGDNDSTLKAAETHTADSLPVTVPAKEPAAPVIAEKKAGEKEVAKAVPSYAPPPPGDTGTFSQQKQSAPGEQQTGGISGPRQQQKLEALDKVAAADRERDANKDLAKSDDMARSKSAPQSSIANNQPSRRAADEKAKGPMRNMENNTAINRNENAGRAESPRKRADGEDRASTEESQTRSAGGRKFRRQGNAWVDQKFKSSMTLKSISRGSSEFAALDGGLRSIAQQLGGEVIVVWKDKAYLIK